MGGRTVVKQFSVGSGFGDRFGWIIHPGLICRSHVVVYLLYSFSSVHPDTFDRPESWMRIDELWVRLSYVSEEWRRG